MALRCDPALRYHYARCSRPQVLDSIYTAPLGHGYRSMIIFPTRTDAGEGTPDRMDSIL